MAAIVSGNSLGLSLTSLATLGQRGILGNSAQGRSSEQSYVNIATGNLVLQDLDDGLDARGADIAVVRTYNSQGLLNDDNGDNWIVGAYGMSLTLVGSPGSAESYVTRTDRDGSNATYSWSGANTYKSTAGAGAFDTITYDATAGRLNWTDGTTGLVESYESTGKFRLMSVSDPNGNAITYAYNANDTVQSMTDANGEVVYLDYTGTNLTQIRTVASDGTTRTSVRYTYDTSNRLASVSVDLTPNDNSVADGKQYVTTYTYDGTSKRVASVIQSDGTSLSFTYVQVAGVYKVATITDGLGQTTAYNYSNDSSRRTTVIDPWGFSTIYSYDAVGQLTQIQQPAVKGYSQSTYFAYDVNGNAIQIMDSLGNPIDMGYDGNGNQILQRDAVGNTVTRTFDARNQLLTETTYLVPDPDGYGVQQPSAPQTIRNVYGGVGNKFLRFVISAEGRVTEYRYNSYGQRTSAIEYAGGIYDTSSLATTSVPTEVQMVNWVGGQDRTVSSRTDFAYDGRGHVQQSTVFSAVDVAGNGVADGHESVTHFVYDRNGLLLSTVDGNGGTTQYTYDGKGRQLSVTDALNHVAVTSYDDANNRITTTSANGLTTTSIYDAAGWLVSVQQGALNDPAPSTTQYLRTPARKAWRRIDPTGVRTATLYDEAGRVMVEIDGKSGLIQYDYDEAGRITRTTRYANSAPTAGIPLDQAWLQAYALTWITPQSSQVDQHDWRIYDSAGRLVRTVNGDGAVTDYQYDGASRLVGTVAYCHTINTSSLGASPTLAATEPIHDAASDRLTRRIYDADGLLLASIDAEGYLTESVYDGEGRLVRQISYANPTDSSLRTTGTLAQLRPAASGGDQISRWLYDAQSRVIGQIDAESYLTEYVYDDSGSVTQTVRYDARVNAALLAQISATTPLSLIRPASRPEDRTSTVVYDALHRVQQRTNFEGTVTQFTYDATGNITSSTVAAGTAEARTVNSRYDIFGNLVAELDGVGSSLLTGGQPQSAIDAIWTQYGIKHTYDAANRRTSTTDANGNRTLFYYDNAGHLNFTVDAMGHVKEFAYNTLGQLEATETYVMPISLDGLSGGLRDSTLIDAIHAAFNWSLDGWTSYTYSAAGNLVSATDEEGYTTTSTFNAFGEEISRDKDAGDGNHIVQTFAYDRRGLVTQAVMDPNGLQITTSAQYDAFGRAIRTIDGNGNVRQQAFDRLGRMVETIDPLNAHRSTTYDAFGRVLTQTDALGKVTSYVYDRSLRSVAVTSPENITTTTSYTRGGQVLRFVDGNGNVTSYTYDKDGNLLSTSTPVTTSSNVYDKADRLIQTTDENGNIVGFTYDAANRLLTRTVDPNGLALATTYEFDGQGRQVSVTDPNGVRTSFAYDRRGQMVLKVLDPGGLNLPTQYTYDGARNTLTVRDADGHLTRYAYDAAGRRVQESIDPDGLNLTRSYAYDGNGNVSSVTDANGNVTRYAYDSGNRLVFIVDALGNVLRNDYDAEGRVVRTVSYVTPISLAGLSASASIAEFEARLAPNALDQIEHRVLDGDGRLVATVSGMGQVVRFTYDANGNVLTRVAFASPINMATWTPGAAPLPATDTAHDAVQRFVYDALNRCIFAVDAVGGVVATTYDGNGNVLERVAYATAIPSATQATAAQVAAAIALIADPAHDNRDRYAYDKANRLVWHADGEGSVTRQVYDANGNVIQRIAYANPIGASQLPSSVVASNLDRVTEFAYNRANWMMAAVDGAGSVTEYTYDDVGKVLMRYTHLGQIDPPVRNSARTLDQIQNLVPYDMGLDRLERTNYDAAGRVVMRIDGAGAVTSYTLDGNGNVVSSTAYANPVDRYALWGYWVPDVPTVFGLLTPSSEDRTTSYTYDADNRLVFTADPLGYVTQNTYDALGRAVETTSYALAIPAATDKSSSAISAALKNTQVDRTQRMSYDAEGRLLSTTDPLGYTQHFAYNALGEKISFTNEKGAVWTYDYDAAGRLISETSPQVAVTATALNGTNNIVVDEANSSAAESIVTRMAYDALGNLRSRTEAYGRPEQRTTSYEYDAVGHQVKVIYPPVSVYDPSADNLAANGASGIAARTESLQTLYTETFYDAFGDAVANRDVAGNYSYKTYDAQGRIRYEVDALGYVTGYERDAWGAVSRLTRFATRTTLADGSPSNLSTQQVSDAVNAPGIDHGKDRSIRTDYDTAGRVITVTESDTFVYDSGRDMSYFAGKVTQSEYNAFGDLVRQGVVEHPWGWSSFATTYFYDLKGQQIATVDAMGYVTTQSFDASGELVGHLEYANALSNWNADTTHLAGLAGMPAASADDRLTLYAYDLGGRKTSETRVGVENSNGTSVMGSRTNLVTSYGYDAVGNLVRTTDATGASTYSYYDALGRVSMIAGPTRNDGAGNLTPLTQYRRDAYGNAVVTVEYALGAAAATETAAAPIASSADHVSLTRFNLLGKAIQSRDAMGYEHYSSYDARGNLAKEWQLVSGNGASSTLFRAYQYDKLGQQTHVIDPASTSQVIGNSIGTVNQQQAGLTDVLLNYDAFGEVTQKSVNGIATEYYDYNNAGLVWRTNAGDGVDKVYIYDRMGQQTLSISAAPDPHWQNDDLRGAADASQAFWAYGQKTMTVYDKVGHVTRTVRAGIDVDYDGPQVGRTHTSATVLSSSQPSLDDPTMTTWHGTNSVTLSWGPLGQLGSGDIKVVLGYVTPTYTVPNTGTESTPAATGGGDVMSRTMVISDAAQNADGVTMTWDDNGSYTGGIGHITSLTIYKKDLYGNWRLISSQSALGYGNQVIDVKAPADPTTGMRMQVRAAGSSGEDGWVDLAGVNFGDVIRYDIGALQAGSYEYRATTTTADGTQTVIGSGQVGLSSPPLVAISIPMTFPFFGTTGSTGLLTWQAQSSNIDQVFRFRPAGSTGAWQTRSVTSKGEALDGVDLTSLPAGSYEFELLWIHEGEGVPYAHATGTFATTGQVVAHWTPSANLPVIAGVKLNASDIGDVIGYNDESAQPIYSSIRSATLEWPLDNIPQAAVTTFEYRLHGATSWSSLPVYFKGGTESVPFSNMVDVAGLAAGDYEYRILAAPPGSGPVAQATGRLIISAQGPSHEVSWPYSVQVPTTITPADPAGYIIGWTGSGPTYGPPVVLYYDGNGNPVFGQGYGRDIIGGDESNGYVYGPVHAISYYTSELQTVTHTVRVQVPVGQQPVPQRDESGNIVTTPVYEMRTGYQIVLAPVQVGTDPVYQVDEQGNLVYQTVFETQYQTQTVPVYGWVQTPYWEAYPVPVQGPPIIIGYDESMPIYARDQWGNIQYSVEYQTQYRIAYRPEWGITGWTTQTVPVQVPVQQPVLLGYQPRYEYQYVQVPYNYQVQVGSEPVYQRDANGNIVYETEYGFEDQSVTEVISVPKLVTPEDPSHFIINAHSGDPVYGPPVVVGHDEANQPIYGLGYSMVNGHVVATPYTALRTEWRNATISVPGKTPAPQLVDTTPPYVPSIFVPLMPAIFSIANTTVPGSQSTSEPGTAGSEASQTRWIDGSYAYEQAVVQQNTDRWGNVVAISDPRSTSWVTTYRYNANNQLIEQRQPSADGNSNATGPVTQLFYDQDGRQTAVRDANGNVQSQVYDAGGNLLQEIHADGGTMGNVYNAFGDRVSTTDAMGNTTTFVYDNLHRLLETHHAAVNVFTAAPGVDPTLTSSGSLVERNEWDQAGRKLSTTDGANSTLRYVYDLRGNVIQTIQPMGQTTRMTYDAFGNKTAEVDANGKLATWHYDAFGRVLDHTDFGGFTTTYTYNIAGLVSYIGGLDRSYTYNAQGLVSRIVENATGREERYEYDLAGNRVREWEGQPDAPGGSPVVYKDNHIAYDALGRMRWVADGRSFVNIDYDNVGNRTHISTHVLSEDTSLDSNLYYQYDAMNRQIVVDAVDAQGNINQNQGHLISYDKNGNRIKDTWWGNHVVTTSGQSPIIGYDAMTGEAIYGPAAAQYVAQQGLTTEIYRYDAMNRLSAVERDGVQTDLRLYDGASRVVQSGSSGNLPTGYVNALLGTNWSGETLAGTGSEQQINRYNANGQITSQTIKNSQGTLKYFISYDAPAGALSPNIGQAYGYDGAGNLLGYTVFDQTGLGSVTNYSNAWQAGESYLQKSSMATSSTGNWGITNWEYAASGELKSITDSANSANNRTFRSDLEGNVLYSRQTVGGEVQRQLVVNGEVLGRYGEIRNAANPSFPGGVPNFDTRAEFNFGYQPIGGNYPAATPGTYAVSAGDTLQSIARGSYGDQNLWYLIADANGLSGNGDLKPGQVLTIPTKVSSANNAGTFKPYDPSKVVGDTSPTLSQPRGNDGGCGGFGQVVVAVVAIVATIYSAGLLSGASGAFLETMGAGASALGGSAAGGVAAAIGPVGTGAVAGAAGSIVSQGVGVAIGAQNGFSWQQVALSAIGTGVTAGVGSYLGPVESQGLGKALAFAGRAALSNGITQGLSLATGLQSSFSWKSVAASAVSSGAAQGLNAALDYNPAVGQFDFGKSLVTGIGGSLVGQVVRGGKISATTLATDAFGNVVGDYLARSSTSGGAGDKQGIDPANPYGYRGSSAGITAWPANMAALAEGPDTYAAVDDEVGSVADGAAPIGRRVIDPRRALATVDARLSTVVQGQTGQDVRAGIDRAIRDLADPRFAEGLRSAYALTPEQAASVEVAQQRYDAIRWSDEDRYRRDLAGFAEAYRGLDDDTVRLQALTNLAQAQNPGYVVGGEVGIGKMPVLWGRDASLLGLPSRLLGGLQAVAAGPTAFDADGTALYLNPRTHSYQELGEIAFEGAAVGMAPTPGPRGIGLMRSGVAFGSTVAERYAGTLARVEDFSLTQKPEIASVVSLESGDLLAQQVLSDIGGKLSDDVLKAIKGNTFTHNHPSGGSFSTDDVVTALAYQAEEFRAVTATRTMSMKFDNAPTSVQGDTVGAALFMEGEQKAIGAAYRQGVAEGTVRPPVDLAARRVFMSDYFMEQLTTRNSWIRYSVTPR